MKPSVDDIPGWFEEIDLFLFRWILSDQAEHGVAGDLVEIGAYYGKSAVVIGDYPRRGERFIALDLFEMPAPDEENAAENALEYRGLTRAAFEANYRRFHSTLPVIVQDFSTAIGGHVEPGSVRFAHIDGSHRYEHVAADLRAAREYLRPEGVVALDDFRQVHTPGTAAAVWGAVLNGGLRIIAVSENKLYGTWGEPAPVQWRLRAHLRTNPHSWSCSEQTVAGAPVLLLTGDSRRLGTLRDPLRRARRKLRVTWTQRRLMRRAEPSHSELSTPTVDVALNPAP